MAAFNEGTCLISGFVIFSVIGFMAKTEGRKISEVADSGNGNKMNLFDENLCFF